MTIIDEEGQAQVWTAHYWTYLVRYRHEADSLEDAIRFLARGEGEGSLSPDSVTGPDGLVVLADSSACWDAIRRLEDADDRQHQRTVNELTGGEPR
jgi:hypothetical protein